jgi:hypothetical protein
MKNQNLNLEKGDLISLWTRNCKNLKNANSFQIQGSEDSPYYLIEVEDNISFYVSATKTNKGDDGYDYTVGIVFEQFVEYMNCTIDKSEFESLVNIFVEQKDSAMKSLVNQIIARGERSLDSMISQNNALANS